MQKLLQGPNSWDIAQACFLAIFTFSSRKKKGSLFFKDHHCKRSVRTCPTEWRRWSCHPRPSAVSGRWWKSCQAMEEKMEAMRQEMGQDVALQAALAVRKLKWQVAKWFDWPVVLVFIFIHYIYTNTYIYRYRYRYVSNIRKRQDSIICSLAH